MVKKGKSSEPTQPSLENATFLDSTGKNVNVIDVIDKEIDCWFSKNNSIWIVKHTAVEKIAIKAGISLNFEVDESASVQPTYYNELEHIVRVTIHCNAYHKNEKDHIIQNGIITNCVHSNENFFIVTGESNRINTPHRGRGYLRKMAEKRGFDIAVLKHLGLHTSIFSEEEAEEFEKQPVRKDVLLMPGSKEFEAIIEEVNLILNAKTRKELKEIGTIIKQRVTMRTYTEKQHQYLKELFKKEVAAKVEMF